jgi:hypothetical protein
MVHEAHWCRWSAIPSKARVATAANPQPAVRVLAQSRGDCAQQQGVVGQGGAGDFQVLRSNSDPLRPQAHKMICRGFVPGVARVAGNLALKKVIASKKTTRRECLLLAQVASNRGRSRAMTRCSNSLTVIAHLVQAGLVQTRLIDPEPVHDSSLPRQPATTARRRQPGPISCRKLFAEASRRPAPQVDAPAAIPSCQRPVRTAFAQPRSKHRLTLPKAAPRGLSERKAHALRQPVRNICSVSAFNQRGVASPGETRNIRQPAARDRLVAFIRV